MITIGGQGHNHTIHLQQVIDTMLSELEFAIAYLDEILMESQSTEQHQVHVYEVFNPELWIQAKRGKVRFFNEKN